MCESFITDECLFKPLFLISPQRVVGNIGLKRADKAVLSCGALKKGGPSVEFSVSGNMGIAFVFRARAIGRITTTVGVGRQSRLSLFLLGPT